jgi:radical SAM superfamily enzyme YgiQ (UPF0313 family)
VKKRTPYAIMISAYQWSKQHLISLIPKIRSDYPNIPIIVGGPTVTYDKDFRTFLLSNNAVAVSGYGEEVICSLLNGNLTSGVYEKTPDNEILMASPILDNIYDTADYPNGYLRWETKRGCPYNCSYCQFPSPHKKDERVLCFPEQRLLEEIKWISAHKISELNIIDAIYYLKDRDIVLLENLFSAGYKGNTTLQAHLNHLPVDFLKFISGRKVTLEIGVQSTDEKVLSVVDRKMTTEKLFSRILEMKKHNVSFVVTLIYGLPFQNVKICKETLATLKKLGVRNDQIKPYPLTLLPGSALYSKKEEFKILESPDLVPRVVATNTFSPSEYRKMENLFKQFT